MAQTPLDIFLLLRSELDKFAELTQLLTETCRLSSTIDRKIPRDPFSCIPVRREISSQFQTLTVCFEQADFDHLSMIIKTAQDLLQAFKPQ